MRNANNTMRKLPSNGRETLRNPRQRRKKNIGQCTCLTGLGALCASKLADVRTHIELKNQRKDEDLPRISMDYATVGNDQHGSDARVVVDWT